MCVTAHFLRKLDQADFIFWFKVDYPPVLAQRPARLNECPQRCTYATLQVPYRIERHTAPLGQHLLCDVGLQTMPANAVADSL